MTSNLPRFTASEVEQRTGVLAATLRQWERRYGFPRPQRGANGYRQYSTADLNAIELMQAHLRDGVTTSRAAELTQQGVPPQPSAHPIHPSRQTPMQPASGHSPLAEALISAFLAGNLERADAVLSEAHATMPTEQVTMQVFTPALVHLGRLWARGEISVAQEHHASAFLTARLNNLINLTGLLEGHGPLVVVACAPGEQHELGLMMLTLSLHRRGLRVAYLGANTPLPDLARFAREVEADAVLLSLHGSWALTPTLAQRTALQELTMPVYYGGALLNQRPELAGELGGEYAGPDAPSAASVIAERLHGKPPQSALQPAVKP